MANGLSSYHCHPCDEGHLNPKAAHRNLLTESDAVIRPETPWALLPWPMQTAGSQDEHTLVPREGSGGVSP